MQRSARTEPSTLLPSNASIVPPYVPIQPLPAIRPTDIVAEGSVNPWRLWPPKGMWSESRRLTPLFGN
jgi:hypothetical protein